MAKRCTAADITNAKEALLGTAAALLGTAAALLGTAAARQSQPGPSAS